MDGDRSSWIEDNGENKDSREKDCHKIEKDRRRDSAKGVQHRAVTRFSLISLMCLCYRFRSSGSILQVITRPRLPKRRGFFFRS
jgi:hypothetical protein